MSNVLKIMRISQNIDKSTLAQIKSMEGSETLAFWFWSIILFKWELGLIVYNNQCSKNRHSSSDAIKAGRFE